MEDFFALHLLDSNPEDVELAQEVFEDSLGFLASLEGHTSVPDNVASECMESLPPGVSPEMKRSFALISPQGITAYYEYLVNFPEPGTCYLGLFIVPLKMQKKGIGRKALSLIERQFKYIHKAKKIRLTYVECDGSGGFWRKMGYEETGTRRPYEHGSIHSEYVVLEKNLEQK